MLCVHRNKIVYTFFLFCLNAPAFAQFWQQTSGPPGGQIHALAVNREEDIFAGTINGMYRSLDNGDTWTPINNGLFVTSVNALAINDAGDVFAGTSGGVYRSTDNGDSWLLRASGLTDLFIQSLTARPNGDIYAGTRSAGAFVSSNNGDTWTPVDTSLTSVDIRALTTDIAGEVLAGTINGVFRSFNDGATWVPINTGLTDTTVQALIVNQAGRFFAGTANGIFMSTDGDSWSDISSNITDRNIRSLTTIVNGASVLLAGTFGRGVFKSGDFGGSWTEVTLPFVLNQTLAMAANGSGHAFAGAINGFYRSLDNGDTWAEANNGIVVTDVFDLALNSSNHTFAGTRGGGIHYSRDAGATWVTTTDKGLPLNDVRAIAVHPNGNIFVGVPTSGVFRSQDGGDTWTPVNTGLFSTFVEALAIKPAGDIFVGTVFGNANLFRSTNNGASWEALTNGLVSGGVFDIFVHPNGSLFAGTFDAGIFRSTNNGDSWTQVNSGLTSLDIRAFASNSQGHIFAGSESNDGVFRSTNNGDSWTRVNTGLVGLGVHALAVNSRNNVFAGVFGGVYRSTNNGDNWEALDNIGLTNTTVTVLRLDSQGFLLAGTRNAGVWRSIATTVTGVSIADSLVLVDLFNSTDGPNWTNNTNWLTSAPVSTWFGVTVEGDRVTQLNLVNNNLLGTLPNTIGNLTNLTEIVLHDNLLSGTIPNEIGNLTNLTFLSLANNQLSGPIPPNIGNLTNLIELILVGNQLSGTIPIEIGSLTNLRTLDLSFNQFSGTIPSEIGNLTNLREMVLASNRLSGNVPIEFRNLVNLEQLHIDNNQLIDLPDLSSISALNILQIQNNRFTFEDIEPNIGISGFIYSPQDSVGKPQIIVALPGSQVVMSATVGGFNNIYEWFKDGKSIFGEPTGDTLTIASVTPADAGVYTCDITNGVATDLTLSHRPINLIVAQSTLSISPRFIYFGELFTNSGRSARITLTNTGGSEDITITSTLVGSNVSEFAIPSGSVVVQPEQPENFDVDFFPQSQGIKQAALILSSNAVSSPDTVGLSGLALNANETDITSEGALQASSEFSANFAAALAVDGDRATSWFSAGEIADGDTSTFRWTGTRDDLITTVAVLSNALHPEFARSFGFDQITVQVLDAAGAVVFAETVALAGTPDSDVAVHPNVTGRSVLLLLVGHESPDCGGFSELKVFANRQSVGDITVQPPVVTAAGSDATILVTPPANFQASTAELFFRRTGESGYQTTALTSAGNNLLGTIPSGFMTIRGVEYYVSLSDGETIVTFPATDPINTPAVLRVQVPRLDFQSTLEPQIYKMISVPLALANTNIDSVLLDDLGPYDVLPRQWRIFRFENGAYAEHEDIAAAFLPGNAFWLITREGGIFDIENAQSVDSAEPVILTLQPGFNQIANPFAFNVDWNTVAKSGNVDDPQLFVGDNQYVSQTILSPWEGYFVNNLELIPITLTFLPIETQNSPQAIAPPGFDLGRSDYVLKLGAAIPGVKSTDQQNYLGFVERAGEGLDGLDFHEPPLIENFIRLSIIESHRRFAGNFKPLNELGHEWEIEVASTLPNQTAVITLTELGSRPSGFEIFVLDSNLRKRVPLAGNQFKVELSEEFSSRQFKVIVGAPEFAEESSGGIPLAPLEFALAQNYPNPFNPETTIRYQLDKTGPVKLAIYNLLGQSVRTLVDQTQNAGEHVVNWDGRDDLGREVSSGVYLYRLKSGELLATRKLALIR